MNRTLRVIIGVLVLCAGLGGGLLVLLRQQLAVPEQQIKYRPIQVNEDGYVSSQTCQACHPSQYESWHASYHRTMTQVAMPETVLANFDGARIVETGGQPMRLEHHGDQLWADFDDPDWNRHGTQPPRLRRQVVMMTGSHQQQVYWYRTEHTRVLGQLPAMYLIGERRWIPRVAAFLTPPATHQGSETGRWNTTCVNCHATHGKRKVDVASSGQPLEIADTTAAEFGIACEACHGPADRHARMNRNPLRRYGLHLAGQRDSSIVQPALLNPRASSQVCGQCHSVSYAYSQSEERRTNSEGLRYRPGDDLAKALFITQPTTNLDSPVMKTLLLPGDPELVKRSFWSDGMIRVSGREYNGLIDSPCFKNATDEKRMMSCSSCHTMHKTPDDPRSTGEWAHTHQVSAGMEGNAACLQCHGTLNVAAHTKHESDSSGSLCYNCHMPYTTYGLLRALRSHQISSPTVAASIQTGRPNACNLCHLDKSLEWTSDFLEKWYATPKVALSDDERTVAASLLWLLKGDAGQRALVAWSMGWQPAKEISSGAAWMTPYLAETLQDPYAAVRLISYRSLRSLPGLSNFEYDAVGSPEQWFPAAVRALTMWQTARGSANGPRNTELLFQPDGSVRMDVVRRLLQQRDDRPVLLRE